MKRLITSLVLVTTVLLTSTVAQAVQYNLQDLVSGGTIRIGDKLFSDFQFVSSTGGSALTAGGVQVVADYAGENYWLDFVGSFISAPGQQNDWAVWYSVSTVPSAPRIAAIDLAYNLTLGGIGYVGIGETVYQGGFFNGNPVAQATVGTPVDPSDPPAEQGDVLDLSEALRKVYVTKDIHVWNTGTDGIIGASIIHQSFHQVSVPDGGVTLGLLGLGLTGLGLIRRKMV